jgi:hypothetical protein
VTESESSHPVAITEANQPVLRHVPCHGCGYAIPSTLGTTCPECGSIWTQKCEHREVERVSVIDDFSHTLRAAGVGWFMVLFIYAVGATVAVMGNSAMPFIFVLFVMGFGVFLANAIGVGIAKLGPEHQFKLVSTVWIKKHYWLHIPWLSIAVFTVFGVIIAVLTRIMPVDVVDFLYATVSIELVLWGLASILGLIKWFIVYAEQRQELGIRSDGAVAPLHRLLAIVVWLASVGIGFIGGVIGTFFMSYVSGFSDSGF